MAFPASIDNFTNPTATDKMNVVSHSSQHANINDAVEALEAKVGADSSAVTTSHDYKIAQLEGKTSGTVATELVDSNLTIKDNSDGTKKFKFEASSITAGNTRTLTVPDASITVLGEANTATVTNKAIDLANNTLTGTTAQFNTALSDGDFATLAGSETLTDKILSTGSRLDASADANFTYHSMARQAVINGNFDVWQRNTTNTYAGGGGFGPTFIADRWAVYHDNGGSGTVPQIITSRQIHTAGDLLGSFYFYRMNVNGAGSGMGATQQGLIAYQKIEYGSRYLCGSGKQFTVSLYARSSIANKKIGVSMQQVYGTGGSPSAAETITGSSVTLTSSWVKYTWTFTTNTIAGKTFGTDNNDHLILYIWGSWGSTTGTNNGLGSAETYVGSGNVDISQVQGCAGNIALPFQPNSIHNESLACFRYYESGSTRIDTYSATGVGVGVPVAYKVRKRTTPTINQTNVSNVGFGATPGNTAGTVDGFQSYRAATTTGGVAFSETWTSECEL